MADDDYPFGLTFNSYQRENSVDQPWKFQGQEHIDDLGLKWDSFKWRNHQPDIGRFFNVDPISEKYYNNSPYAFSENKVVAHVELEGLESWSSISAEEINGQWTMGSDNHISTEAEAKAKIETQKNTSSKEKNELIGLLTGNLETSVNLIEQNMSSAQEGSAGTVAPLALSRRTLSGVGLGLSIVNLSLGAIKFRDR